MGRVDDGKGIHGRSGAEVEFRTCPDLCFFAACVLRKSPGVIRARNIKRRVERQLKLWTDGHYDALVQDIVGEAMRSVGSGRHTIDEDLIARKYNSMVLDGKLRAAVCFMTKCDGGGVLLDKTTGDGSAIIATPRHQDP